MSGQGVAADPNKIMAMVDWPIPKDVRGLRDFLGLTGYYRKFVEWYGKMALDSTAEERQLSVGCTRSKSF